MPGQKSLSIPEEPDIYFHYLTAPLQNRPANVLSCEGISMLPGAEPDTVVTLVHGTFARKAAWCRPGSPFVQSLEAAFGQACTSVFEWSGSNSHTARLRAAAELQEHLRGTLARYPRADHFIVAHSHGGNVAAYALRDEELQKKIRGLVCIGTPFIRCTERDLNLVLGHSLVFALFPVAIGAAIVLSPLLALAFWFMSLAYGSWYQVPEPAMDAVLILFFGLAVAALMVGTGLVEKQFEKRVNEPLSEKQQSIIKQFDPPFVGCTPVLNVTAAMDEAGGWLWILRHLSGIPFYLWRPLMIVAFWAFVLLEVLVGVSLFFFVVPSTLQELPGLVIPGLGLTAIAGEFAGLVTASVLPSVLFLGFAAMWCFLMFITPKVIRSSSFGFGGEKFIDNLLVDIRTHEEPFAATVENLRQRVTRFRPVAGSPRLSVRLGHSALCSDPRGIERMVRWLKAQKQERGELAPTRRARTAATPLGLV